MRPWGGMLFIVLFWACSEEVGHRVDSGPADAPRPRGDSTRSGDGPGAGEGGPAVDSSTTETEVIPAERRVVWQGNVGIPGGIPQRTTICSTIDATAYGDGSADATGAIQSALDSCPDDQVVLLPAGTYRITDTIRLRSRRVLRGAGPDVTTISYQGSEGDRSAIAMAGWPDLGVEASVAVTAGADKGSSTITLQSAADVSVGSIMLIDQLADGELVVDEGVQGKCTHCGRADGDRVQGQLVEVTAVNGDQISFNIPLYWSYRPELSPLAVAAPPEKWVRWSGVEDLKLTQPEVAARYLVEMQATAHCWLKNVEIERVDWRAVWMLHSLQSEVRGSYFHESINGYGRSHGYGVLVDKFSSANLVEDNIFHTLDGGLMMTGGGAAGNVFGYNYGEDSRFDDEWWLTGSPSINHAPHPMMNLWEGNVGYKVSGDFIWGSSSHITVYRSLSRGWQREVTTSSNAAVELATNNTHINVVGCVLGTEGRSNRYEVLPGQPYDNLEVVIWLLGRSHGVEDPEVAATLLRHGNFDTVNNDVVWDPKIPGRDLPPSLYYSAKPAWFGDAAWPPIGPDVPGRAKPLPAQLRFKQLGR